MEKNKSKCERCGIRLDGWINPIDCGYCDPICPVFGIRSSCWTGDEDESQELFEAVHLAESLKVPRLTLRPLTLDWAFIAAKAERWGRGAHKLVTGGLCCTLTSTYELMNMPRADRIKAARYNLEEVHGLATLLFQAMCQWRRRVQRLLTPATSR